MGWTIFEVVKVSGIRLGVPLQGMLVTHGSLSEVIESLKIGSRLDAMNVESA